MSTIQTMSDSNVTLTSTGFFQIPADIKQNIYGRLPEVPEPSMPAFVQALRFMADPFALLAEVRKEQGDIFALRLPGLGRVVFLCSARLLHKLYKLDDQQAVGGEPRKEALGNLVGPRASLSVDGKDYAEKRRVMAPFFSARHLAPFAGMIEDLTAEKIASWPRQGTFTLQDDLSEIAHKTICRVLFGPRGDNAELYELSTEFVKAFRSPVVQMPFLRWNLGPRSPWGRFLAAKDALRTALAREVRRRMAAGIGDYDDLMSGFIQAQLSEDEDEAVELVVQEMVAMVIGGSDTTAASQAWLLAAVLSHGDVEEKLRAEITETLGERPLEASDLRRMPYLDAVLNEGLRYQPMAPFAGMRRIRQGIELGRRRIPVGTMVVHCLSEVGRDPVVFPNPDHFDPNNFYGRDVKMRDWVPFGGGVRVCAGMALARLELAVVLVTIVRRGGLRLDGASLEPVQRGITFQPKALRCSMD